MIQTVVFDRTLYFYDITRQETQNEYVVNTYSSTKRVTGFLFTHKTKNFWLWKWDNWHKSISLHCPDSTKSVTVTRYQLFCSANKSVTSTSVQSYERDVTQLTAIITENLFFKTKLQGTNGLFW